MERDTQTDQRHLRRPLPCVDRVLGGVRPAALRLARLGVSARPLLGSSGGALG